MLMRTNFDSFVRTYLSSLLQKFQFPIQAVSNYLQIKIFLFCNMK